MLENFHLPTCLMNVCLDLWAFCFFLQSSQWGLSRLRYRHSEDVSRRKDWVRPLAHESGAEVHHGLRWPVSVGEKRRPHRVSFVSFEREFVWSFESFCVSEGGEAAAVQRSCGYLLRAGGAGQWASTSHFYWLFLFAISTQKSYFHLPAAAQALKGHGIDRHLLGLKLQAIEDGLSIPKIFMDTAYGLATHWKLRTGQVGFGLVLEQLKWIECTGCEFLRSPLQ